MRRQNILVVDDNPDFLESVSTVFWDAGYSVSKAMNASQALEVAARSRPDLCVVDVAMPGSDGIQLIRYFRSRHVYRQIPMILLTAGVRRESLAEALDLGVKDVFLKSKFSAEELIERVNLRLTEPREIIRSPELNERPSNFRELAKDNPSSAPLSSFAGQESSHLGGGSNPPAGIPSAPTRSEARPSIPRPSSNFPTPPRIDPPPHARSSRDLQDLLANLKALPKARERILAISSDPQSSLAGLESVVRVDPVLALRLVSNANSAFFARGTPVFDLAESIQLLGIERMIRLVANVQAYVPGDFDEQVSSDLEAIWRHSIATAVLARRLSPESERNLSFLAGLFHDLPALICLQHLGDEWLPLRAHCLVKGISLREGLAAGAGLSLEDVWSQILAVYPIPSELGGPLLRFQDALWAGKIQEPGTLMRRVEIAHHLAIAAGRSGHPFSEVRGLFSPEVAVLDRASVLDASDEVVFAELEEEAGLGSGEDALGTGVRLRSPVAFWRDPSWTEPDPVESALSRSGECMVVRHPEDLKIRGYARLAMVEPSSPQWSEVIQQGPLLVLHRNPLPDALPAGVETLSMPVPIAQLVKRLRVH